MKVVLLAGGLGTRIAEESDFRPKPMIELGGRPILWHIMKLYAHHGLSDFVICCGYKGYMIKEYFANYRMHNADLTVDLATGSLTYHSAVPEPWTITLVDTGAETMTGGRLKRVAQYLGGGTFCMTYGDGVSNIDVGALANFHRAHGLQATLTAVIPPGRYGALEFEGDRIARFVEKPPGDGGLINGGYFVLEPAVLDRIAGDETPWEAEPLESLARDGELMAFRHTGFWRPMDTLRDKRQLEALWAEGAPWKVWA
ncbi:MAG: glucose-1-phosphate cytidylyltransferase [Pseudomonadota bacterium]